VASNYRGGKVKISRWEYKQTNANKIQGRSHAIAVSDAHHTSNERLQRSSSTQSIYSDHLKMKHARQFSGKQDLVFIGGADLANSHYQSQSSQDLPGVYAALTLLI